MLIRKLTNTFSYIYIYIYIIVSLVKMTISAVFRRRTNNLSCLAEVKVMKLFYTSFFRCNYGWR